MDEIVCVWCHQRGLKDDDDRTTLQLRLYHLSLSSISAYRPAPVAFNPTFTDDDLSGAINPIDGFVYRVAIRHTVWLKRRGLKMFPRLFQQPAIVVTNLASVYDYNNRVHLHSTVNRNDLGQPEEFQRANEGDRCAPHGTVVQTFHLDTPAAS
jgi:hypothetical protein